ncbi:MAG: hypothetical protein PHZ00_05130 [Candidatus Peribacteraceae bacterium]|nr:hypothetical protein [Candidatus Peribacteraceae bacterium]
MEAATPPPSSGNRLREFFLHRFSRIREINEKYRTPRIKTTRTVSIALYILRFYLLLLTGILFYKFISTLLNPS